MKISPMHSTTLPAIFLLFFTANTFFLHQPILGLILLTTYLGLFGFAVAALLSPRSLSPFEAMPAGRQGERWREGSDSMHPWWMGVWLLLSLVMILGSVAYYVASVPAILFQLIVIATPIVLVATKSNTRHTDALDTASPWKHMREKIRSTSKSVWVSFAIAILTLAVLCERVQSHPILDAVRSPWDRIDVSLLALFTIAAVLTFTFLYRGRERALSLVLFSILLLSLFSFAAIVFPVGYGFDAFIHKATEAHLAQYGTITPKPFYYIGQYTLVLFFSHAFSLPIDLVDTFLVPLLAAILLPLAWYAAAVRIIKNPRHALFALVGLFLLPLDSFVVTTPQSLANLWTLLVILASVPMLVEAQPLSPTLSLEGRERSHLRELAPILIGTIATMLIHPIAGIPVFFFLCLLAVRSLPLNTGPAAARAGGAGGGRVSFWALLIAGAVMLPASFIANAIKSGQGVHLNVSNLNPAQLYHSLNLDIFLQNKFSPLLDFVYLYGQNRLCIIFLVSAIAWWIYRKDLSQRFYIPILMIVVLGVNYLLLANVIDFSFLIDYERSNYATRLLPLMAFFLSPFLILAIGHVSINIRTRPIVLKLCLIVCATAIATSAFYLAYPRHDAYENNRGFNVSQADVDAVYLVDEWAKGTPYIALANQSVSAAAIKNLGFRYYGTLFFYPIPTGDPMYQLFLKMNDIPSRKIASDALALVPSDENVHTVFYIVDTYWWESTRIIETTKSLADDWKSVDGSVYVFRFDVK